MDSIIYEAIAKYYHALEVKGYMSDSQAYKLLVMAFYNEFVKNDYRGTLSKEDYHLIEKALDCLYGTTCLIPYPDYLKMGKLHLGQMEEIDARLTAVEKTKVVKGKNHIQNIPDIDLTPYDQIDDKD